MYAVKYKIKGFKGERVDGPYDSLSEAYRNREDISSYAGVEYAVVLPWQDIERERAKEKP